MTTLRNTIGSLIDSIYDANVPTINISLSNTKSSIISTIVENILNSMPNSIPVSNYIPDYLPNSLPIPKSKPMDSITKDALTLYVTNYIYNNQYILNNYIEQNSGGSDLINRNNENIIAYSIIISISLSVISIILMIVFKIAAPTHINITELLLENIGTFIFVGAIEYWFFTTYAFNYIPMPASLMTNSVIDEIKQLLQSKYKYTNSTDIPPYVIKPIPIILN